MDRIFTVNANDKCISSRWIHSSSLIYSLALLTAVLLLEEVDWAGVGGPDQPHLMASRPSHLWQNGDSRQRWRGGESWWKTVQAADILLSGWKRLTNRMQTLSLETEGNWKAMHAPLHTLVLFFEFLYGWLGFYGHFYIICGEFYQAMIQNTLNLKLKLQVQGQFSIFRRISQDIAYHKPPMLMFMWTISILPLNKSSDRSMLDGLDA